ncbi:MAG: hypothetical protein MJ252_03240 [archaeon]|nr:hypothetical protein [archaeon]
MNKFVNVRKYKGKMGKYQMRRTQFNYKDNQLLISQGTFRRPLSTIIPFTNTEGNSMNNTMTKYNLRNIPLLEKSNEKSTKATDYIYKVGRKTKRIIKDRDEDKENMMEIEENFLEENNFRPNASPKEENNFYNVINPQICSEYRSDIYRNFKEKEKYYLPMWNYFAKRQNDLAEEMRVILYDWISKLHLYFRMKEETLFLTFNIIDRFLSYYVIKRTNYQLVAISALLIASKYEEMIPPYAENLLKMTESAYSKQEMMTMENNILRVLHFDLTIVTPLSFLQIYNAYFHFDNNIYLLSLCLIEVSNLEFKMIKYLPSVWAVSAILLSYKAFKISKDKMRTFISFSQYNYNQIYECMTDMYNTLIKFKDSQFNTLFNKFCSSKFDCICRDIRWERINLLTYDNL